MDGTAKRESHLPSARTPVEGGVQDACGDACSIRLEPLCEIDPSTVWCLLYFCFSFYSCKWWLTFFLPLLSRCPLVISLIVVLQITCCKYEFQSTMHILSVSALLSGSSYMYFEHADYSLVKVFNRKIRPSYVCCCDWTTCFEVPTMIVVEQAWLFSLDSLCLMIYVSYYPCHMLGFFVQYAWNIYDLSVLEKAMIPIPVGCICWMYLLFQTPSFLSSSSLQLFHY